MKHLIFLLSAVLLSSSLQADELVQDMVFFNDPLTISAVPDKQRHLLVVIPDPAVNSPVYALQGKIRYSDVEGDAFLQMDNDFGEIGTFFTKSVAPSGPLGKINGSSDWRPFVLPFNAGNGDQAARAIPVLKELTLSLYLPGSGTVSIQDVELRQYASGEDPLHATGQWFSARSAGLIGGIGGGLLGLWGALIGVLSSRGKARGFVLGSANTLLIVGIACIIAGVIALASTQPYAVYYPLLLIGIIVVAVISKLRGALSAQYEQLELKRMQSMDA